MSLKVATGGLVVWTDVVAEHEAEFVVCRRTFTGRLAIPGFCNVRRYMGAASPKYLTYYETETAKALTNC